MCVRIYVYIYMCYLHAASRSWVMGCTEGSLPRSYHLPNDHCLAFAGIAPALAVIITITITTTDAIPAATTTATTVTSPICLNTASL